MKIRFETTIDDYLAFHRFHYTNSPTWRRQRALLTWLPPAALVLFTLAFSVKGAEEFADDLFLLGLYVATGSLCAFVPAILWVVLMRWLLMASLLSSAKKLISEGTNRTVIGWRELELVDGRLNLKTELVHSSYDLRAIEKIVGNDEYTFIYLSAVNAIFIPMQRFPEEEYQAFVAELRDAWENRDTPKPAAPARPTDERIVERPH